MADAEFLQRERQTVEKFLVLHEEATAFIRKEPAKASQVIADFVSVVDNDFVLDTLKVSPKYCASLSNEFIASTMKFVPVC